AVIKRDRVAGVVAKTAEALIALLAGAALSGVWCSCSPEFGSHGVLVRLGQIAPRGVFFTEPYSYNGDLLALSKEIAACMAGMPGLGKAVVIDHLNTGSVPSGCVSWSEFLEEPPDFNFQACAFDDPLFIMFSSGTTGVPKCIVHGVG